MNPTNLSGRAASFCLAFGAAAALLAGLAATQDYFSPSTGVMSVTPQAKYWLRMYPLQPYSAYWHLELKVDDLAKALPKVQAALEKNGGTPTVPVSHFAASKTQKVQQLSFRLALKTSEKALKALQALGTVEALTRTPAAPPDILEEVRDKLARLKADADANQAALAAMPAVSAAVQEIREHLSQVDKVSSEAAERVLLNMQLREAR